MPLTSLSKYPAFGVLLGLFGALIITPDTLFMRLSEMDVWVMMVWRGLQMGGFLLLVWLAYALFSYTADKRAADMMALFSRRASPRSGRLSWGNLCLWYR